MHMCVVTSSKMKSSFVPWYTRATCVCMHVCARHMFDKTHSWRVCTMTYSCEWHDFCDMTSVTWLLWHDFCDMTSVTWLLTHLRVRHDSFTCAPWLIHICTMTHLRVRHDLFTCTPWLIYVCAMTHSHVHHDSLLKECWDAVARFKCMRHDSLRECATWFMAHSHVQCHSFVRAPWLTARKHGDALARFMRMRHDSFMCMCHDSFMCVWYDTWTIHMCALTHNWVMWRYPRAIYFYALWRIQMIVTWVRPPSHVWHDSQFRNVAMSSRDWERATRLSSELPKGAPRLQLRKISWSFIAFSTLACTCVVTCNSFFCVYKHTISHTRAHTHVHTHTRWHTHAYEWKTKTHVYVHVHTYMIHTCWISECVSRESNLEAQAPPHT